MIEEYITKAIVDLQRTTGRLHNADDISPENKELLKTKHLTLLTQCQQILANPDPAISDDNREQFRTLEKVALLNLSLMREWKEFKDD